MDKTTQTSKYLLDLIRNQLSLEQLVELINSIKNKPFIFLKDLADESILIKSSDIIQQIDDHNDFSNIKVIDLLNYHFSKNLNPADKLIEAYKTLSKSILPAGFITGKFKSITFEQIPQHPIAIINFDQKKNVTIKAVNNIIELSL